MAVTDDTTHENLAGQIYEEREGGSHFLFTSGDLANNWAPANGLPQLILGTLWNLISKIVFLEN